MEKEVPLVYYDEENVRHVLGTATVYPDGRIKGVITAENCILNTDAVGFSLVKGEVVPTILHSPIGDGTPTVE